jgi:hypothetical protein
MGLRPNQMQIARPPNEIASAVFFLPESAPAYNAKGGWYRLRNNTLLYYFYSYSNEKRGF